MTVWDRAGSAIAAAFADPEPIVYTGAGLTAQPLRAVRLDAPGPDFQGAGDALRQVAYEVRADVLSAEPRKSDSFTHRGRRWRVQQVERRPEIAAWVLTVTDGGPA